MGILESIQNELHGYESKIYNDGREKVLSIDVIDSPDMQELVASVHEPDIDMTESSARLTVVFVADVFVVIDADKNPASIKDMKKYLLSLEGEYCRVYISSNTATWNADKFDKVPDDLMSGVWKAHVEFEDAAEGIEVNFGAADAYEEIASAIIMSTDSITQKMVNMRADIKAEIDYF